MPVTLRTFFRTGVVLALAACEPKVAEEPTWVLDTFSSGGPSAVASSVTRYTFSDGGLLEIANEGHCEGEPQTWRMRWEPRGENAVAILAIDDEEPYAAVTEGRDEVVLRRDGDCGPFELQENREDGSKSFMGQVRRGALCTERLPPCEPPGSQCDECMLVWCDDEPEPCDEG